MGEMLSGRCVLGYVKTENFHKPEEALGEAPDAEIIAVRLRKARPF